MKAWELFEEENEAIRERYELSMERIAEILQEHTVAEPYRQYFRYVAGFVGMIGELLEELQRGRLEQASLEKLKEWNQKLYGDVAGAGVYSVFNQLLHNGGGAFHHLTGGNHIRHMGSENVDNWHIYLHG